MPILIDKKGLIVIKTHTAPSCKTRSACHEETLTGNAKRELAVYRVSRPYITTSLPRGVVRSSHCWL